MIVEAILKINPNAKVSVTNASLDEITWHDETPPIPKADIEAKVVELQADYDALEWKRNRIAEYPNHEDCIHALLDGGDTLTDLQAQRTTIKEKYPKE